MYSGLHVKYSLVLLDFDEIWIFSIDFLKKLIQYLQISNFITIHSVGAELFHVDGQRDRYEANSRFSQFC